eukprot:GHRR01016762.1.p1 GENE.GHRR01016762.1~~GHRR01016762.1.p1  ORF type:complete len:694 (+),score=227.63 GHRR01016762.1:236-2317(+)
MRGKGGMQFDADVYDDGYDDDDYYDDYEDYDDAVPSPTRGSSSHKGQAKPKPAVPHKPHAPAAAAATTHIATLRPPNIYPLSPGQRRNSFDFNTPSPDDKAKAAMSSGRATVGIPLAPSKTPTVKQQQQAAQARKQQQQPSSSGLQSQHSIDEALHELHGLHLDQQADTTAAERSSGRYSSSGLGPGSSTSSSSGGPGGISAAAGSTKQRHSVWRPLRDYHMEADLARDIDAALAGEAAEPSGRRGLHLVVMGHVDAGKSTLMGRLLHDLGQVSQKEVHKNQKEAAQAGKASFAWAWILDERPEERARGVTVDVAVARFTTPKHDVTLLDAPGHRDFVPNMISGAAQADAALLIVDGSPGGFESGFFGEGANSNSNNSSALGFGAGTGDVGGQTKEHAQLARSLGVEQLAVVISKLDTCDYSQERYEYIKCQLLPFLKSVGYRESRLQWLPAVGPLGHNLVAKPSEQLLSSWWQGPTLVEAIDAFTPKLRNTGAPLRLAVHDAYKGRQGGLCVGGKLEGGALKPGSKVMVVPGFEVGVVKSLEVNGKGHAPLALAGDSADVLIAGLDAATLHAGAILCHPDFPVRLAVKFTVQVLVLAISLPILKGHAVTVHAHTAREAGVISGLLALCDPKTGQPKPQKPRCLLSGQTALVEVTPVRPLALELFVDLKTLGRVALREGGRTVAVGIVTQVQE